MFYYELYLLLFKIPAKLLIAGGRYEQHGNVTNIVEIVDLINPSFTLKWNDDRAARIGSIGGIFQDHPLICGGRDSNWKNLNNGIILGSNQEIPLIKGRRIASSVVLNETRLLVTGGVDENRKDLNSSEFISLDQPPEDGPKLPFTVSAHCMVQVDSTSIYLIGGWQDKKKSEKTWIIDAKNNFAIKEGPKMNFQREGHSCATMRLDNKTFIVVVGSSGTTNTEILDTSLPTNKWKPGK